MFVAVFIRDYTSTAVAGFIPLVNQSHVWVMKAFMGWLLHPWDSGILVLYHYSHCTFYAETV